MHDRVNAMFLDQPRYKPRITDDERRLLRDRLAETEIGLSSTTTRSFRSIWPSTTWLPM